jgi:hypothetical protein
VVSLRCGSCSSPGCWPRRARRGNWFRGTRARGFGSFFLAQSILSVGSRAFGGRFGLRAFDAAGLGLWFGFGGGFGRLWSLTGGSGIDSSDVSG